MDNLIEMSKMLQQFAATPGAGGYAKAPGRDDDTPPTIYGGHKGLSKAAIDASSKISDDDTRDTLPLLKLHLRAAELHGLAAYDHKPGSDMHQYHRSRINDHEQNAFELLHYLEDFDNEEGRGQENPHRHTTLANYHINGYEDRVAKRAKLGARDLRNMKPSARVKLFGIQRI